MSSFKNLHTQLADAILTVPDVAALASVTDPQKGDIRYVEDIGALYTYNGSSWSAADTGVVGPVSTTDNALPRWDGTDGTLLSNSGVVIDDTNNITGAASLSLAGFTGSWIGAPILAVGGAVEAQSEEFAVQAVADPSVSPYATFYLESNTDDSFAEFGHNLSVGASQMYGVAYFSNTKKSLLTLDASAASSSIELETDIVRIKGPDAAALTLEWELVAGTRSITSTHTANRANAIPDADGDFVLDSAEQTLTNKDIDGGTASDSSRLTLPGDTKANLDSLTRKAGTLVYATDESAVYMDTGSVLKAATTSLGSSTDNTLVRWDGTTGTSIQSSSATLSDSGLLSAADMSSNYRFTVPGIIHVGDNSLGAAQVLGTGPLLLSSTVNIVNAQAQLYVDLGLNVAGFSVLQGGAQTENNNGFTAYAPLGVHSTTLYPTGLTSINTALTLTSNVAVEVAGDLRPLTDGNRDLGSGSLRWNDFYITTINAGNASQLQIDASGNITKINNITTSFPETQGDTSTALTNDGFGNLSWVRAAYVTSQKTANYTAVNRDLILADTSGGAFTITLPATPSLGDVVMVVDNSSNFSVNNVVVARNGSNIRGAASDFTLNTDNTWAEFIYGGASRGWEVRT